MEQGCQAVTQVFVCNRKQKPYVDLVTKIAIGGRLVNVVLSSDSAAEIERYRKDYDYLLKHLALVK